MARLALTLACALGALAHGAAFAQGIVPAKSEIRFVSRQMGVEVEGRFRRFRADVDWRPDDLAHTRADFAIELASIDLASEEAEDEVRRPGWFDTAKFPVATFTSTAVRATGADRYEIAGKLALKGVTRDVVVPVALRKDAAGASVAEGQFTVKRLEFRIGDGPWADPSVVADEVQVRVRMTLAGPP